MPVKTPNLGRLDRDKLVKLAKSANISEQQLDRALRENPSVVRRLVSEFSVG